MYYCIYVSSYVDVRYLYVQKYSVFVVAHHLTQAAYVRNVELYKVIDCRPVIGLA